MIIENPLPPKLGDEDYALAAELLQCPPAAIKAITVVESRGHGFEVASGVLRPIILFEGHVFSRETDGQWNRERPDISHAEWDRTRYTGTQEGEWHRLTEARKLDRFAADKSASWGLFQIMGFNFAACGCTSVVEFVNRASTDEREQLLQFVAFMKHERLAPLVRAQNWAAFAQRYNGPGYRANRYDLRLANAFAKFSAAG